LYGVTQQQKFFRDGRLARIRVGDDGERSSLANLKG
jgi:hypothetical protein